MNHNELRELVKLANHLDNIGEAKLASDLDEIIKEAGWADWTNQALNYLGDKWTDLTEGTQNSIEAGIESLKQRAIQGERWAYETLERMSEQPAAVAAGVTKALEEANKAFARGYTKELVTQKGETLEQTRKKQEAAEAARAAGAKAVEQGERAASGLASLPGAAVGVPVGVAKDVQRGAKHVLQNIEAPPDLNQARPAVAKSGGVTWRAVQERMKELGKNISVDGAFGPQSAKAYNELTGANITGGTKAGGYQDVKGVTAKEAMAALNNLSAGNADDHMLRAASETEKRIAKFASLLSGEFSGLDKSVRR